mmetsp:Transcript_13714/g.34756  ORF Transcript_13714/g.34756 Transcript_13714/m.34756 type:complete len:303 (+) Transcript_13714:772-1680(+)
MVESRAVLSSNDLRGNARDYSHRCLLCRCRRRLRCRRRGGRRRGAVAGRQGDGVAIGAAKQCRGVEGFVPGQAAAAPAHPWATITHGHDGTPGAHRAGHGRPCVRPGDAAAAGGGAPLQLDGANSSSDRHSARSGSAAACGDRCAEIDINGSAGTEVGRADRRRRRQQERRADALHAVDGGPLPAGARRGCLPNRRALAAVDGGSKGGLLAVTAVGWDVAPGEANSRQGKEGSGGTGGGETNGDPKGSRGLGRGLPAPALRRHLALSSPSVRPEARRHRHHCCVLRTIRARGRRSREQTHRG